MDAAHTEWVSAGRPFSRGMTRMLTRRVWELGFDLDVPHLYPMVSASSWDGAEEYARTRLEQRGSLLWPTQHEKEHSPLTEFQYDVAWACFDRDYDKSDFITYHEGSCVAPHFQRLVLALESELANGPKGPTGIPGLVLYDFNKLLCARADIRVMVWPSDKIDEGVGLLESRLLQAEGWNEGSWLLSGWGRDGFEHVEYHNGQRQN